MKVAILCAATKSIYHTLPDVVVYDTRRDARTFCADMPAVGHPPCRAWSAYCAHQAKPLPGEKELGLWVVDQLRHVGGVLEQPAHSRLFAAAGIPLPGEPARDGVWSIQVDQSWWGDSRKKATWLAFFHVHPSAVNYPLLLRGDDAGDRRRWQVMSKTQRSATPPEFAAWLVSLARMAEGRQP